MHSTINEFIYLYAHIYLYACLYICVEHTCTYIHALTINEKSHGSERDQGLLYVRDWIEEREEVSNVIIL